MIQANKYLSSFRKLWKTKKALEDLENKEKRVEILKYYYPKTRKKQGSVTWHLLADRVFSEYDRLYYCDDKGYCTCITCKMKLFWRYIQAGHFITRKRMKYTFDIINVYPQCETCNVALKGNYIKYTLEMIKMLGKTVVEKMLNDKRTVELKQYRYEEKIIEWYDFICDKKRKIGDEKN